MERSWSERAYAGGAGDLYTGHRGDLGCGGSDRPGRHLQSGGRQHVYLCAARILCPAPRHELRDAGFCWLLPTARGRIEGTPDLLPSISHTSAGQTIPSGRTDTPFFSATIADTNIGTTDSLSIELTGGGGKLSDGAGFSGLTESAPGVYVLSGTTAAITSELEALVFTPNTFSATTTFTLVDTTSLGTRASNANTTVTVTNGEPVVVSVSRFLADQSTLDADSGRLRHS